MTVQYDYEKCYAWVARAKDLLSAKELAQLWMDIAFVGDDDDDAEAPTLNVHGDKQLVMQWAEMSLWERQAVLYLFIPQVVDLARRCAWDRSQEARRKEPL